MSRKTATVQITADNRDKGKTYLITEMPAAQTERIAARLFLMLSAGGVDIPDTTQQAGMAGLVAFGMNALKVLPFEQLEPVMEETFNTCVSYIPDIKRPEVMRGAKGMSPLIEDDIEEVSTRFTLRKRIISLHTGFFEDAAP